ncbi:MAG: trypsin-like peptidase domain-containing protein [bacterium]
MPRLLSLKSVLLLSAGLSLVLGGWGVWRVSHGLGVPAVVSQASAAAANAPQGSAMARRTEIVDAAERVSPAVVSIGASRTSYVFSPVQDFFSNFTISPYKEKIPYLGSGVIIDPDGLVITNDHVVRGASEIFVTMMDGRELSAMPIDSDEFLDVALLKVNEKNLPAVKMGNSDELMVGEWVLAMGNPFGNVISDPRPTVTVGVVSALGRSFRADGAAQRIYQNMIQTDAAINPGNSGGPLINASGELVGINTFIVSRSGGSEGVGFAIPVNHVKIVADEIIKHGRFRSRMVDFHVLNVNGRMARMVGSQAASGAIVADIARAGPAERAGLRVGDIVVSVNGCAIKNVKDFASQFWTQQVGSTVRCEVDRGGKKLTIDYTITEAVRQQQQ